MVKKYRFLCLILCIVLLCSLALQANAQESGSVYRILTLEGFLYFAESCRLDSYSRNLTVVLCGDIDLSGTDFGSIPIFSGTFEGNGHTISGIDLDEAASNTGLFRYLTEEAIVRNLHVTGSVNPAGSSSAVGGIAGVNEGTIENCSFEGSVSGTDSIGGLVGINQLTGIIDGCTVRGSVHGNHFIGGIAGDNYGVIRNCENHGKVNTTVEQNAVNLEDITLDSIVNSESASTVTDIGGICGTGTGVIRSCTNYGSIGYPKIGYNIGGIAGSFSGYIDLCVNHADVDGRKEVGGIVGQLEPAVNMIYEEDTLQTLQQQMDDLSNTTSGIGASIQSGSNALNTQSQQIEQQLKDAQDALNILIPKDEENPTPPDEEAIQAAQNALSSSLSDLTGSFGTMAQISQNTLVGVAGSLQAVSGQMNAISGTIGTASENMGGGIRDVSDEDTEEDITSKIHSCKNLGSIRGDWNIGGIAGAIGLENDLDPESDLQIIGNTSLNFDMQLRSVIRACENKGTVLGKKQNAGGIAGWVSLGLLKDCVNTADIDAASADYAGGIAGQSSGFLRSCSAKCSLSGNTYVGGIAGSGTTVTDCRAIVQLVGATEKFGAILGAAEEADLSANYYLVVDTDHGAVDGISYDTHAQPLKSNQFFALEALPDIFRLVTITFVFDNADMRQISLPYGSQLSPELIPSVPPAENSEAVWVGPLEIGDQIYRDITFHLESTAHIVTVESDLKTSDGLPVLLVQGEFPTGTQFTAAVLNEPGSAAAWEIVLPESETDRVLRCKIPSGYEASRLRLLVRSDGDWTEAAFTVDGSYLVFPIAGDVDALQLQELPKDNTLYYITGAAAVVLITAVTLAIVKRKKKSK